MEIKSLTNQLDYLVHRKGEAHAAHRTGGVSIEQGFFRAVERNINMFDPSKNIVFILKLNFGEIHRYVISKVAPDPFSCRQPVRGF